MVDKQAKGSPQTVFSLMAKECIEICLNVNEPVSNKPNSVVALG